MQRYISRYLTSSSSSRFQLCWSSCRDELEICPEDSMYASAGFQVYGVDTALRWDAAWLFPCSVFPRPGNSGHALRVEDPEFILILVWILRLYLANGISASDVVAHVMARSSGSSIFRFWNFDPFALNVLRASGSLYTQIDRPGSCFLSFLLSNRRNKSVTVPSFLQFVPANSLTWWYTFVTHNFIISFQVQVVLASTFLKMTFYEREDVIQISSRRNPIGASVPG
jgi:hypothetical protein